MNKWVLRAIDMAPRSSHPKHHMVALVVKGGAVLSFAVNGAGWGRHAEMRALRPNRNYRGATLYVIRAVGKNSKMSRPCEMCHKALVAAGIAKIVYCDWDGNIVIEKV